MTLLFSYFLQFFAQMLPLWGQYWPPYLKLQSLFLNSISHLFWHFFPIALTTIDILHNFIIFSFIVSLSLDISILWKFWAYPYGIPSHVCSKSGKYLEGETDCALAETTEARAHRQIRRGFGNGVIPELDLFFICRLPRQGQAPNSPWYVVGTQ